MEKYLGNGQFAWGFNPGWAVLWVFIALGIVALVTVGCAILGAVFDKRENTLLPKILERIPWCAFGAWTLYTVFALYLLVHTFI